MKLGLGLEEIDNAPARRLDELLAIDDVVAEVRAKQAEPKDPHTRPLEW